MRAPIETGGAPERPRRLPTFPCESRPIPHWRALAALLVLISQPFASLPAHALGTSQMILQPTAAGTDDTWFREDGGGGQRGDDEELRIGSSPNQRNRNSIIRIPLSGLNGRTVLRAWLELRQSAGNSTTPIDARIYPLTESWDENVATWTVRDNILILNNPWATPGGTHSPFWSDRALVSTATNNGLVRWQVGPIVQAWNMGTIPNHGWLVEPGRGNPNREVAFRSSDYDTAAFRPKLVIQYTDEPPAIRQGIAEIQPRSARVASPDAPITVWLDVDAQGTTPSGASTGFDEIIVTHGGALQVTGVDRLVVNQANVPTSLVTFSDDGNEARFHVPRVRTQGQVELGFRAKILSDAKATGVDLPISVDDSATPGVFSQALWPGNADRVLGNGDDWILQILATPPVAIDLTPDNGPMTNLTCIDMMLVGRDQLGNVFPLVPDSVQVIPKSAGTVDPALRFCAGSPGLVRVVAHYGALRDTSVFQVQPERLTQIHGMVLRDRRGNPTGQLVPADTMFLDVTLSDGDGLQDVGKLDFTLQHTVAAGGQHTSPYGAHFHWLRGSNPSWVLDWPLGTSWQILPALCSFDEADVSPSPSVARLAFVVSGIARASNAGEWGFEVIAASNTPPVEAVATLPNLNVLPRILLRNRDSLAAFSPGLPGATGLPLETPPDMHLALEIEANAPVSLDAHATDLVGKNNSADTLHVGEPVQRLHWALRTDGVGGGDLGTNWTTLANLPPQETEPAIARELFLWIDHPPAIPDQPYAGTLGLRIGSSLGGAQAASDSVDLEATVVAFGLAAQLALAEITPHTVRTGTGSQPFSIYVRPIVLGNDTGVDRIRVSVPPGYGKPVVTEMRVGGSIVPYQDRSAPGLAEAVLVTKVTTSQLIELRFQADTPVDLDLDASPFIAVFDDESTSVPPQTSTEGDANSQADGNNWSVAVVPGPVARLVVSPESALMFRDSSLAFSAVGEDVLGHPVSVSAAWRVEGGIGTITSGGLFVATTPGSGRVIAESGGFADTVNVTVLTPRAIALRAVHGPAAVYQGQSGVSLDVRIENLAPTPVTLDTLRLLFSRGVPGDANADFPIIATPSPPLVLAPGTTAVFGFVADVAVGAILAPLAVTAIASGVEEGSGIRLRDTTPDSALAMNVVVGGVDLFAFQTPGTVRPGAKYAPLLTLRALNHYPEARILQSLTLRNKTVGPGTPEDLDSELGEVSLYRDDGDGAFDPKLDELLLRTSPLDGTVTLAPLSEKLEALATGLLFMTAELPTRMRDGDLLDVEVTSPGEAVFDPPVTFRNSWPLGAQGGLLVDGMTAAQIAAPAVGPTGLNPGATDRLAFQVIVPANGYEPDMLTRLAVTNHGSALPGTDVARLRAWGDNGDGSFSPASDQLLGTLAYTGGNRWQLTGLAEGVPGVGRLVFVTADAATDATENATIKLALPASPDHGLGMQSGNSGPIDVPVVNAGQVTISNLDRVSFVALPLPNGSAAPGERDRPLMRLAITNSYAVPRTLTTLVLDNATAGPGTPAERDGESRLLTLRADANGDGALDTAIDPVLGTSFFSNGEAAFTGLDVSLGPFASQQLFVTVDLSLTGARDGDAIGALVEGPNSVGFAEPTTPTGLWPLDSGARWTVDGFVAAQVTNVGAPGVTVGPGDGPVLALDVVVPPNGYATDMLRGVRVMNLGTATAADLAQAQLWRDGGDGAFQGGGDDLLLGPLTAGGGEWTSPLLAESFAAPGARLFVSITIGAAPAESATVRLAIPANGAQYDSNNDGPRDVPVANAEAILLSTAPLLASLEAPGASTLGQTVRVAMTVRNTSPETVRGVTAPTLTLTGTALLTPLSGPLPATFDLAPAQVDTFEWQFRADGVGEVRFSGSAGGTGDPSGLPRNAPQASSNLHHVFHAVQHLALTPVQTMPIRVNRGQTDVVPFSLTLVHPGGPEASDVRVERLRVRLEEESGAPIVPQSLLSRVVVNEGTNVYLVKTSLEATGSEIDLSLTAPATVTGTQPTTLSLRLDIASSTVVPTFRVVIDDSTRIVARDVTSGAPVVVRLENGSYPVRSDVASVVAEATELDVIATTQDTVRAGRGTVGATLARLRLVNPGVSGISSDVRVAALAVALVDSTGADEPAPGGTVSELRLLSGAQVLAQRAVTAGDPDSLVLAFSQPLDLAANTPLDIVLVGDIAANAPLARFAVRLLDSTHVDARDANTRVPVTVTYTPDAILGGPVTIEAPADTILASGTRAMPPAVLIGQADVLALVAVLRHPDPPGTGRLRIDGLEFDCVDDFRSPLVPALYLDRVRVRWNGVDVADLTALPTSGNRVSVPFPSHFFEPGDTARVELRIDVDASAPGGWLELIVPPEVPLAYDDNTEGAASSVAPSGAAPLPLRSGLGRLILPARELSVGMTSLMPAVLAADGRSVPAARLTFRNADPQGAGPILLDHLIVRASDRAFATTAVGLSAARLEARVDGVLWAQSALLTPDSVTAVLTASESLAVMPGTTRAVEIVMITATGTTTSSVRLGVDHDDIGVVQPSSALLAVNVRPEPGLAFPLWTDAGGFSNATLAASYANFPNPFAAGREATTVVFFLPGEGRVWLRVFTLRGEPVATLLDGAPRSAGLHQSDAWDGRNGNGEVVRNGVYIAELEVRFDDGSSERLRRKVAVTR